MILPGSYQSGFAPRDGRPLYPELWRGCGGAWAPCLGPTGLTLRDWSGLGNHGTLTNMDAGTDWVSSQGRYALDLDGSNDYVACPAKAGDALEGAAWSFSGWVFVRSNTLYGSMISMDQSSPFPFSFRDNFANGQWAVICDGTATLTDSGSLTLSQWTHFAAIRNSSGSELYRNGIRVATGAAGTISANSDLLLFGTDFQPGTGRHLNGLIDDIRVYSRRLSVNEIRTLASRRGIAYEFAPRRRSSTAVQFNRRRRLLVGASN